MRAADGVWAAGDVTGEGAFTHVAVYQAGIAVRDILGEPGTPADYRALSRVTFTDPEIGAAGLTEAQARRAGRRRADRDHAGTVVDTRLDPQGWKRRVHQARRRRQPSGAGGRHVGGARPAARC